MYKIYINDCLLILTSREKRDYYKAMYNPKLIAKYLGKKNNLLNYIDLLEKATQNKTVLLYSDDYYKLQSDFKSLFAIVPAAGGIVVNEYEELLFIFRRDNWDLPKGKMDGKETKREAAVREVKEETGVKNVQLLKKIGVTRHTFNPGSKKRAIKKSHWYLMQTKKQKLTPQLDEDIEKAEWMSIDKLLTLNEPVYISIIAILEKLQRKLKKDSWENILGH